MIKKIFGWLWNFNHIHEWKFNSKVVRHIDVMGLTTDSEDLVYTCTTCGKITILK